MSITVVEATGNYEAASFRLWEEGLTNTAPAVVGDAGLFAFQSRGVSQGSLWITGDRIVRPVRAVLGLTESGVVLTEATTGIFGAGDAVAGAVTDLRAALREHLDVLASAEVLSAELEAQLAFLRWHLAA